ncbi:VOC family protein [Rhodococcus sp. NPDC047139]|uniref:VOC family protein n=1 Tax=Rhodococcus sp. NPDC047139 TaxID=3155141 RepID=UPI0033CEA784
MFRGLTTTVFVVDDLRSAVDWYSELLGIEPYFQREAAGTPAYVEFRTGDFQHELGFLDSRFTARGPAGTDVGTALTYWAVDDIDVAYKRLLSMGATTHQDITERGEGFVTASVIDPFGNVLGVMYNQHYLDVVASVKGA